MKSNLTKTSSIPKFFIVFINFRKTNSENLRENNGVD